MAFVNLSLIFGGIFIAIPVVLHLVMRQQPKHLIFPALRFIKQRRDANRRKLQLRHWLLLFLRCLAIGLLALALARPSVHSMLVGNWVIIGILALAILVVVGLGVISAVQRRGRALIAALTAAAIVLAIVAVAMTWNTWGHEESTSIGHGEVPVAAVLVFDTSPRMLYQRQNESRLDQAKGIALWLTQQLPADSELAVVESRPGSAVFSVDIAAARSAIERMEITAVPQALTDELDAAVRLAESSGKPRKEVYLFTDLTRGAWTNESASLVARRLAENKEILLYIVDVGVEQPTNFAVADLRLSADALPKGGELSIQASVARTGSAAVVNAEVYLEEVDPTRPIIQGDSTLLPKARLRHQQTVEVPADGAENISFRLSGMPVGTHQGYVSLAGQDPLVVDDTRYFAIAVQQASPVLVLAPDNVVTKYFTEAIAPYRFRQTGQTRFECTVEPQSALPSLDLRDYAAVCLLDPTPLTPLDWQQLVRYVEDGGGAAVFLGHNADQASFNHESATRLLGGKLARVWRATGDLQLEPRNFNHPITNPFRDISTTVPWNRLPIHRHWVMEDFAADAALVIPMSNNKPAVIETRLGRGRALTMTTPVSDPLRIQDRQTWNELPTSEDAWPYLVIVNEMMKYLVDASGSRLNYFAGETAVLSNSSERHPDRYQLFTPLEQPQDVTAGDGRLVVRFTEFPGAYRLKGNRGGTVIRGFAVNLPASITELDRLSRDELDDLIGADRYQLARDRDDIVLGVGEARMGREFFPFLVCLLALVLAVEQVFANRFYRATE